MVDSIYFHLPVIFVYCYIYVTEIELLSIINLKEPDSRNLKKRHARTPLRGEPLNKPCGDHREGEQGKAKKWLQVASFCCSHRQHIRIYK